MKKQGSVPNETRFKESNKDGHMNSDSKEQHADQPPLPNMTVTEGGHFGSQYFGREYFGEGHFGGGAHAKVTLDLSPEVTEWLNRLMNQTGESPSDLFRKALALYKLAKEAVREGKAVGVAENADSLETEFIGL
jgi:hypothetical protein